MKSDVPLEEAIYRFLRLEGSNLTNKKNQNFYRDLDVYLARELIPRRTYDAILALDKRIIDGIIRDQRWLQEGNS